MNNKKVIILTGKNLEEVFNRLSNAGVNDIFDTFKSLIESTKSDKEVKENVEYNNWDDS